MIIGLCVTVLVRSLIQKAVLLAAVDYIYAYDLVGKFSPVQLLADCLNLSKQRMHNKGNKSSLQQVLVSYVNFSFLMLHIYKTQL